jgi:hypothetical protein
VLISIAHGFFYFDAQNGFISADTIPIMMITLIFLLNTKPCELITKLFITSINACSGQSIIAVFSRLMEEE